VTPRISVVSAVRGRVQLLRTMLDSLVQTAADPGRVDVVLRCDFDDAEMIGCLSDLAGPRFIVGPRVDGYASLPAFANEAARLSCADLVLVVNDDAEFQTPGWDTKLVEVAAQYPDGLFVLGVDTLNAGNFVFPCVSRKHIELFGGVFDTRVVYADIWSRDVYAPFGLAIRVPDVRIDHRWQGMSADQRRVVATIDHDAYVQAVEDGRAKVRSVLLSVGVHD
jgi:hypothetical protein